MSTRAADDFEMIRAHMRKPAVGVAMCPMNAAMPLHQCLRSAVRCQPAVCPMAHEWIGPLEVPE